MNKRKDGPPGKHEWIYNDYYLHTCYTCNIISIFSPSDQWEWMFRLGQRKWRKNVPATCEEAKMIEALE